MPIILLSNTSSTSDEELESTLNSYIPKQFSDIHIPVIVTQRSTLGGFYTPPGSSSKAPPDTLILHIPHHYTPNALRRTFLHELFHALSSRVRSKTGKPQVIGRKSGSRVVKQEEIAADIFARSKSARNVYGWYEGKYKHEGATKDIQSALGWKTYILHETSQKPSSHLPPN